MSTLKDVLCDIYFNGIMTGLFASSTFVTAINLIQSFNTGNLIITILNGLFLFYFYRKSRLLMKLIISKIESNV